MSPLLISPNGLIYYVKDAVPLTLCDYIFLRQALPELEISYDDGYIL